MIRRILATHAPAAAAVSRARATAPVRFRRLVATLALATCAASAARAAAPSPDPQVLLYGNESAATADDARGLLFNPAAVGVRYPSELFVSWTRWGPKRELNNQVLALGGFALQAQRLRDSSQAYGFSLAAGGERLRWGSTSAWLVDAHTHEIEADHRIGLLSRPAPWLSCAYVLDHLTQPVFRYQRLSRLHTLAVGLRPLALSRPLAHGWGTRLTLTGDVTMVEDGEWRQSRVRVGGELELLPGLMLRGAVEDHRGLHVGFGLRGPRLGLHAQSASVDGAHRYDTYGASLHSGEDASIFASPALRRVAVVRAGGRLGDDALSGVSLLGAENTTPVKPLRDQLERALDDPLTRGVLLDLRGVSNMAQIEELRPRVEKLRRAGKPVVAYFENGGGRGDFYLAGVCDRIVATPEAEFGALGLRVERRYYRQLLASWGVRMDRTSYGKYKSAFRNFSVDSTPAPDREAIERSLDVQQELFVSALTADRKLDRARLLGVLDGRMWSTSDLQSAGLVDSVGYRDDALRALGRLCGLGEKPRTVDLRRARTARREWTVPERIAVVYASGGIDVGRSGNDLLTGPFMGSETVTAQIESAFRTPGVKAVVLRVESPGGSAVASGVVHHATARMKRETGKPLVVSMGGVAASGGYYISSRADRIFADRFTRTGSIGVLQIKPSLEGWYRRHDVRQDAFDRGDKMWGWSQGRDWTPEAQAIADSATLRFYRSFVGIVAEDRKLPEDQVDAVAQGRVWLGEDALERRLVDQIGGLDDAIAEARRRAGIPEGEKIRLREYRRPRPGFLQRLVGSAVSDAWERTMRLPEPGTMLYRADDEEIAP
ncbi:MAG: S49 family peptidase [Candidatus Eisenbacteria bacterium]|nr:S49 family peptidase [Candidatus Eisenbacteria bacterium]